MSVLIVVKNKSGAISLSDFSRVYETGLWPEPQTVKREAEALGIVKDFLSTPPRRK